MYNGGLSIIGLLTISTIIIALAVLYANIEIVNAQKTEPEEALSQEATEYKIAEVKDPFKGLIISTLNAEGSNSQEDHDECQDDMECSDENLNEDKEDKEDKEEQPSVDILLPFP